MRCSGGPKCLDVNLVAQHILHTHTARGGTGEGGEEVKKRKKSQNSYRRDVENRRDLGSRGENVDKRALV